MTAASPPLVNFGWRAPDFRLADTKGKVWTLDQLRGPKGLLLMFICNHCPYVLAVIDKLATQGKALHDLGFGVAAICSNDAAAYPEDSYEKMGVFARAAPPAVPLPARRQPDASPAPTAPPAPRTSSASTPS